jgi:outer membrane receptor protein involved in Fe transport
MTGQINVELKKPFDREKFLFNGYFNEAYRSEVNLFARADVGSLFKTAVMGHYSLVPKLHDRNGDGFGDMPKGNLFTIGNRWDYHNLKTGLEGQLNIQYLTDHKESGTDAHYDGHGGPYMVDIDGERLQAIAKLGYVFPEKRYNSIGSQWGFSHHDQTATIGHRLYDARQISGYANVIYQSIFGDTRHQYFTGISFRLEDYKESLDDTRYDRQEIVPGAFIEYTYKPDETLTLVTGVRADKHNLYDWLINPRVHLRYAPRESLVFRVSAGRGMRSPLPIAENLGWLASSRKWSIGDTAYTGDLPFNGLRMEKAWNFGGSITKEFILDFRPGVVSVDFYHTRFSERAIVDLDVHPQQVWIYNLQDESFANTFQVEAQYEILKRLDLKVAYKLQDSKITYVEKGLRDQILTPQSRFFVNMSYISSLATYKGHWRLSLTAHHTGTQRIPDTGANPAEFQLPSQSRAYWLYNGQITRVFNKNFEVYAGMENISQFRQSPVIIDAENPHGEYFDSGLIWGPIFGREWFVGFRYTIIPSR